MIKYAGGISSVNLEERGCAVGLEIPFLKYMKNIQDF
jgi:hypothetical protein